MARAARRRSGRGLAAEQRRAIHRPTFVRSLTKALHLTYELTTPVLLMLGFWSRSA
jgi:hypothetical protein